MFETRNLESLLQLFNLDKKKELERYCRDLVIYSGDFTALILAGQVGILEPYLYANHFMDRVPEHLHPNNEEHEALRKAKVGLLEEKSRKFVRKAFQIFQERRCLAAHLFYMPCHTYWHLFYFDQRDQSVEENHWKHGPHIHLISSLWPNQNLEKVWGKVRLGDTKFPSKVHIMYLNTHQDEDP